VKLGDLFDLTGNAIVTGGGSGIGRQMAEGLAEMGADLVLCARHLDRCEAAAEELRELGVRAGMRCDVRDPNEVEAVVERTRQELGRLGLHHRPDDRRRRRAVGVVSVRHFLPARDF
jgi:NAD(P)-dependent dehydrogenase (short-subunit alcohol dehydrogenase family)